MQRLLDEGACTAKEHNSLTQPPEKRTKQYNKCMNIHIVVFCIEL